METYENVENITQVVIQKCRTSGKICYSKRDAGGIINTAHNLVNQRRNIPKRMYFCRDCGFYHLTHYAGNETENMKKKNRKKEYVFKKQKRHGTRTAEYYMYGDTFDPIFWKTCDYSKIKSE